MSTVRGGGAQKSVHPLKCPSKSLVPLDLDRPSDSRTSGLGRRAGGPALKTDECGGGGGVRETRQKRLHPQTGRTGFVRLGRRCRDRATLGRLFCFKFSQVKESKVSEIPPVGFPSSLHVASLVKSEIPLSSQLSVAQMQLKIHWLLCNRPPKQGGLVEGTLPPGLEGKEGSAS